MVDERRVAFLGTMAELVRKVETGEMVPKLQSSHALPYPGYGTTMILIDSPVAN